MERKIKIGDRVRIDLDGKVMELSIVESWRQGAAPDMISVSSPLARVILDRQRDEVVEFSSPSGPKSCRIIEIVS